MTTYEPLDRTLTTLFADEATAAAPADLADRIVAVTVRLRPRPRWRARVAQAGWSPSSGFRMYGASQSVTRAVLLIALAMLLVAGVAIAGALILNRQPILRGVFEPAGALPIPATIGLLIADGRLLVFGGTAAAEYGIGALQAAPEPMLLYDPTTGASIEIGITAASVSCAVGLDDGRVLAIELAPNGPGGGTGGAVAELINPNTGEVNPLGQRIDRHLGGACVRLADGRVLLVGDAAGNTEATLFDPATNSFAVTGSTSLAMMQPTATLLADGRILVVGEREPIAQLYDPATGTFSPTGAMSGPHEDFTTTLLRDGRVLIAGGWATNGTVVDGNFFPSEPARLATQAEIYDPATNRFSPVGPMSPRVYHFAVALMDGRVLIGGGSASTSADVGSGGVVDPVAATVELFDPATGAFTPTGALSVPRFGAGAVLMRDGTVLVVGSVLPMVSQGGAYPAGLSVEIYR